MNLCQCLTVTLSTIMQISGASAVWKEWGGIRWEAHAAAGERQSLCFLPAQIKQTNWHSTTGGEGSVLDCCAWKAAFHPISSQCWVLGAFLVTQLCLFYLVIKKVQVSSRIENKSFSIFIVWSIPAWFICICIFAYAIHNTQRYHFLYIYQKWNLCCQSHVTWHSQCGELQQLQATKHGTHPGYWCGPTAETNTVLNM